MVFFNCNACGESLKKNQVEKHYKFKCRQCEVLSCVDCGKEFWGDGYEQHTKCISEEEKYSGKDYKPKAGANKGEQKQEAWTQHVQAAVEKARTNPKLRSVLLQIKDYTNIPRKKAKYENFLRNSMRIRDEGLIKGSWELISAEMNQQNEAEKPQQNGHPTPEVTPPEPAPPGAEEATEKTLNKRERKEERQKKNKKKDKKKQEESAEESKKKKKRKHEDSDEDEVEPEVNTSENGKKKKSKKRKQDLEAAEEQPDVKRDKQTSEDVSDEARGEGSAVEESEAAVPAGKFDWEATIVRCLRAADKELSLKKLKKKVMAEFWAQGGDKRLQTEDKALAKFHKKVSKNPRFKLNKDRVKLDH